jgi:AcrR family transcriptional regulator
MSSSGLVVHFDKEVTMVSDGLGRARTPSREVERALVDAAETVLVRAGLAGVTVRAVAAEAGVAPMGVYSRFSGKEGLERELLIRGFTGLARAVQLGPGDGDLAPVERIRESGLRYRQFAVAHPQHYQLMFRAASSAHFEAEAVRESAARAIGVLVDHVARARADGTVPHGDPDDLAQQLWSAMHGAVSLELAGSTRSPDPEQMYARMLDLLIRGLRTAP